MPNGIGLHVLFDKVNTSQAVNDLVETLDDLQPAVVNVVGGARMTQAFEFARALVTRYPKSRIIFRAWPDDGNHAKSIYADPNEWIRVMTPFLSAGLTVLTDNESTTGDYSAYVKWSNAIMNTCGLVGWSVAVGRQPTGNPGDGTGGSKYEYDQFLPMLQTLHAWGNLHTLTPNEYVSNRTFPLATSGHTVRFLKMWDVARNAGLRIPDTSVGEWNVCIERPDGSLDAGRGFRHSQFSGNLYADHVVDHWTRYYKPSNVPIALYGWGDSLAGEWDSFRLDVDRVAVTRLRTHARNGLLTLDPMPSRPPVIIDNPKPPAPLPTPEPTPTPVPAGIKYVWRAVIPGPYVNIRSAASTGFTIVGSVKPETRFHMTGEKSVDASGNVWYRIFTPTLCGWVSSQGPLDKPKVRFLKEE